ncbi:MAG: hypothetical protein D6693_11015 [Planctomycetota bacterium]|nr:MAG: hypothetical protein D6693_11015 [Planctomycetota bacterium]
MYYYPSASSRSVTSPPARAYEPLPDYRGVAYADGWTDLALGHERSAFRYFSRAAARAADDGAPKVGYAIAAAMLGDHRRAAWAMRRALTTDPYSLSALRLDERLLGRLDRLAESYADAADGAHNYDADFMLAALSELLGDHALARIAIDTAIERGDRSDAARILRDMIPDDTDGY